MGPHRGDRRPLVLIYGGQDFHGLTFREEIDLLAAKLRLKVVYVLVTPPAGWTGEKGLVSQELLRRHMPGDGHYEYLICGPPAMLDTVEQSLRRLGVPIGDYHSERFDLA